jgi:UDP-3-O-[3-hydroxymyristoyl] glucosamine N-acyltransferase
MGFLDLAQIAALAARGIRVLDPFSTLVSPEVEIAAGALLYPNVILERRAGGRIRVGTGARLMPGTHVLAAGGTVRIGDEAEIGEDGGFSLKAQAADTIAVGGRTRLTGGGTLRESCDIGDGAQVLGRIDVRNCRLAAGGDYRSADPDRRGAVLKGVGQALGLVLAQGRVIQAFGLFSDADVRWQSFFHPSSPR